MTYFGFLLGFLALPILILIVLTYRDLRLERTIPSNLQFLSPRLVIAALTVIAVIYTTPWDNYLVANMVWWYDPALVTGITLGWVPLEEYTFFVLQTIMTGLWLVFLARRISTSIPISAHKNLCRISAITVSLIWVAATILLLSGWEPGTYLALELIWAIPPIALQFVIGADILWHYRQLVGITLITSTLYLSAVDLIAIRSGTWTINPEMALGVLVGGVLPVEEVIFFFLTNALLVFGLVLALAKASSYRLPRLFGQLPSVESETCDIERPPKIQ
ncbi:MAG: lycopene cyclase domain-containing protein [Chloroflexota bacterium]